MIAFRDIEARALDRHGPDGLARHLSTPRSSAELAALPDDRYLSAMTSRVFAAGFRWRVIQAKWDGFEEAFHGFDPAWVAGLEAGGIDALATDTRIVRNRPKIVSTVNNARFVQEIAAEHGGFGAWIAGWPLEDTVGLWAELKARGDRLGGDSGPWFLRHVGRDTFRLSSDVVAGLIEHGVVGKTPTSKKDLAAAQAAMVAWAAESGRPLCQVSQILACSVGAVSEGYH